MKILLWSASAGPASLEPLVASLGHEAVFCRTAEETTDALAAEEFAVLLVDLRGSPSDRAEKLKQCGEIGHEGDLQTPQVVAVLSEPRAAVVAEALDAGAHDCLSEPLDVERLRVRLVVAQRWARIRAKRIRTRNALKQSEERARKRFAELEHHYRTVPVGLCMVDNDLRYIRVNGLMAELSGRSVDEHFGRTVREILPDLADAIEPMLRQVMETGEPVFDLELRGRLPSRPQEEFVALLSHFPLRLDDGTVSGVSTVFHDITERENLLQALSESEETTRVVLNTPFELSVLIEPDGRVLAVNETMAKHMRTRPEDLVGKILWSHFPKEIAEQRMAYAAEIVRTGEPMREEDQRNGRFFDTIAHPIKDRHGKVVRIAIIVRDITERRQMEETIRSSEERNRKLLENVPSNILLYDANLTILYINHVATGYKKDQVIGQRADQFIHPPHRTAFRCAVEQVFRTAERQELELADLFMRTYIVRLVPLIRDGRVETVLGVSTDITNRRKADEKLAESEQRFQTILEHAPVMIDSFDAERRCILWNKECEKYLGWKSEEVMACADPMALFYSDPKVRDAVWKAVESGDGTFRPYTVRAKDGSPRRQQWANFRLPNGNLISVGLDVTDKETAGGQTETRNETWSTEVKTRSPA